MGRTLGPFTDVSTARVDGAYEIYEGLDDEGRDIEILTLGISSSKDPSRRALLSDTVAWAHATRGPADAPILKADLNSEQPYVVTLRQTGYRGVERMLERMLAMGPATGPLSITPGPHTGQIPRVSQHTNPHGIPAVVAQSPPGSPAGSPVAPASPMTPYVTNTRSTRPAWLVPLIAAMALLVLGGGGVVVAWGLSDDDSVAADSQAPGDDQSEAEQDPSSTPTPRYDPDAPIQNSFGGADFGDAETNLVEASGWPFAFQVPADWDCQVPGELSPVVACMGPDHSDDTPAAALHVELVDCPDECDDTTRQSMSQTWQPEPTGSLDADTAYFETEGGGDYQVTVSRFFTPAQNTDLHSGQLQLIVSAIGTAEERAQIQQITNDILGQTAA